MGGEGVYDEFIVTNKGSDMRNIAVYCLASNDPGALTFTWYRWTPAMVTNEATPARTMNRGTLPKD
jgi:hypothetical protein